ncbi:MAG: AI-2E family transporter [Pseudohongiella sp.]|nr:MAG: AI-2E family transporter [Pseudohongiella sp.]
MKLQQQIIFWAFASLALFLFVWTFRAILLPFVVGVTIAYLLNPLLLKLDGHKISRTLATLFILISFLVVLVLLVTFLLPPLYREVAQLAEQAPQYVDSLWVQIQPYVDIVEETVDEEGLDESLQEAFRDNIGGAISASTNLLGGIWEGGRALFGFATFIVVTPLVAFFMMVQWQQITTWIDSHLPRHSYDQVKSLLEKIDKKIAGFIRGQLLVALSLGVLYAIALSVIGLQYGFLIGVAAGMLSIIPLFGSIVGFFVGIGVAWMQNPDIAFVLTVAAIFAMGQFLEGNFIAPKLIGESVGLHPLWILFSLMAGAALFGIVGMVLAVPVAATAGVLIGFTLEQYRESPYFE